MKKLSLILAALILGGAMLFTACDPFAKSYESDGSLPSEVATSRGEDGSASNWLASLQSPSTVYRTLYEEAKRDGSFQGTYFEFLQQLGISGDGADGAYVQSALRSAVTVECAYTVNRTTKYSLGSGVFYDVDTAEGDAYVVTNYHVVYNASSSGTETVPHISDEIKLYLYGGETSSRAISASYLGGAMDYDIAVLKVENSDMIKGNSSVQEIVAADSDSISMGQRVYAIGNPEGEGMSVVEGVVSVDAEYIDITASDDKTQLNLLEIRTDAAVNHGNSGGGLFNAQGELVGIVNARSEESGVVGFGYAIPANLALSLVQNIIDSCEANPSTRGAVIARMGIEVQVADTHSVYDETSGKNIIEEKVVVHSVEVGSAAIRGGIAVGDTIHKAVLTSTRNGKPYTRTVYVTRMYKITNLMVEVRSGDTLTLTVTRGNEEKEIAIEYTSSGYFKKCT